MPSAGQSPQWHSECSKKCKFASCYCWLPTNSGHLSKSTMHTHPEVCLLIFLTILTMASNYSPIQLLCCKKLNFYSTYKHILHMFYIYSTYKCTLKKKKVWNTSNSRYFMFEENYTKSQVQASNLSGQRNHSLKLFLKFKLDHVSHWSLFLLCCKQQRFFPGSLHLSEWLLNSLKSLSAVLAKTKYPNHPSSKPPKDWSTHASGKYCEHPMQKQLLSNQKKGVMCSTISQLLLPLSSHFLPIYFPCCF